MPPGTRSGEPTNMPPKMLQDLLGHASIEITMRHYVHVDEQVAVRLLETLPLTTGQKVVALKAKEAK